MTDLRNQLKTKICGYFLGNGVGREALPRAIAAFKECAEEGRMFDEFFHPRHHEALEGFQKQYFAIMRAEEPKSKPCQLTRADAQDILSDPQSSPSLLREAVRILG